MYAIFVKLFIIGFILIAVGFLGRAGTAEIGEVDTNIASAFALIFIYALVFSSFSSFSELVPAFESMSGGIFNDMPFVQDIADYGSLKKVIEADPLNAAISFLDTVILSTTINILSLFPFFQGNTEKKGKLTERIMVKGLIGVILGLIALFFLNVIVKESAAYWWVVSVIGIIISFISLGTLPLALLSMFAQNGLAGVGVVGALLVIARSKLAGILRDSFLKAIVFVLGIYLLEKHFGSIAAGVSQISLIFVAFGPVLVMLVGIGLICKVAKLWDYV